MNQKSPAPAVSSPLDPIALSAKAKEFCRKAHIRTPRDLVARKGTDFRRLPGGKAVADELERAIRKIVSSRLLERESPVFFRDNEGSVVRDFPLFNALLSGRARYALDTLGITTAAQLAAWSADDLKEENIRNVGRVTIGELISFLQSRRVDDATPDDEARAAVLALFTPAAPAVPRAACEAALAAHGVAKARAAKVLQPLTDKGILSIGRGTVQRAYLGIDAFLDSMDRPARDIKIVKGHLNGKTLEAAGRPHGLTRERVRQIYRLIFADVIRIAAGHLAEDRYDAVFRAYAFTQDDFCAAFGEPIATFRYLDATRPAGKGNPYDAAADASLDKDIRSALRAWVAAAPAPAAPEKTAAPAAKPAAKPAAAKPAAKASARRAAPKKAAAKAPRKARRG